MKIIAILIALFATTQAYAEDRAVVLAASATSSAPGSAPITCLLDPDCKGYWSPGSADSGVDEGIYVQFEKEVLVNSIEITFAAPGSSGQDIAVYLNGKTTSPEDVVYTTYSARKTEGSGDIALIILGRGGEPLHTKVKSFFMKLGDSHNTGWAEVTYQKPEGPHPKITSIRFFDLYNERDRTNQIKLALPVSVSASVSASSILEPEVAYDPSNLFDSRYDFAWSTNGKKTSGIGESFTIKLHDKRNILGLIVWNGYQRSKAHFNANGSVLEAEVVSDDGKIQTVKLKDVQGPQQIIFEKPFIGTSTLKFIVKMRNIFSGMMPYIDKRNISSEKDSNAPGPTT